MKSPELELLRTRIETRKTKIEIQLLLQIQRSKCARVSAAACSILLKTSIFPTAPRWKSCSSSPPKHNAVHANTVIPSLPQAGEESLSIAAGAQKPCEPRSRMPHRPPRTIPQQPRVSIPGCRFFSFSAWLASPAAPSSHLCPPEAHPK